MTRTLIIGGARSGKSLRAEARVRAFAGRPVYVATAEVRDEEMARRVALHRARRGPEWLERPALLDLSAALDETDGQGPRLIDCLTLWLSNVMLSGRDWEEDTGALMAALDRQTSPVVLVTNEVGFGIVPETPLGRAFRDAQGLLNHKVAAAADVVELVVAGLPLILKDAT